MPAASTPWKTSSTTPRIAAARSPTGGNRRGNQGYFFEPTVITDVPDDSKIMTQEPFGPLAPVVPFKTFDEVVERANSLPFGLAAYAFTSSAQTATLIGDALQSGMVGVNSIAISTPETPFGGVKKSGYGSEGGIEGCGLSQHEIHLAGLMQPLQTTAGASHRQLSKPDNRLAAVRID